MYYLVSLYACVNINTLQKKKKKNQQIDSFHYMLYFSFKNMKILF